MLGRRTAGRQVEAGAQTLGVQKGMLGREGSPLCPSLLVSDEKVSVDEAPSRVGKQEVGPDPVLLGTSV